MAGLKIMCTTCVMFSGKNDLQVYRLCTQYVFRGNTSYCDGELLGTLKLFLPLSFATGWVIAPFSGRKVWTAQGNAPVKSRVFRYYSGATESATENYGLVPDNPGQGYGENVR